MQERELIQRIVGLVPLFRAARPGGRAPPQARRHRDEGTTFCMEHNWLLGLFNEEAQVEVFGRQAEIISPGSLAPKGKATPV